MSSKIRSLPMGKPATQTPLSSSFEVRKSVGEPPATIRVKNLKTTVAGPQDAWGRKGTSQPILVTAEVSLYEPFPVSATNDAVSHDTVHYGKLSKEILAFFESCNSSHSQDPKLDKPMPNSLTSTLDSLYWRLVGCDTAGDARDQMERSSVPLLKPAPFWHVAVAFRLPKASLLGNGVSLAASTHYDSRKPRPLPLARSMTATIHELRVPTLVGVNPHERQAKQIVVATVEVDRLYTEDINFSQLEAVIVKTMEGSSFETLEALTDVLVIDITKHLRAGYEEPADGWGWLLKITLEKPTAVTFADAACVEVRTNTNAVAVPSK